MPIEIGKKVFFTLNGNADDIYETVWHGGEFLGMRILGEARELVFRVRITDNSDPDLGFRVGEEKYLNATDGFDKRSARLICWGEEDSCVVPETREWTMNFMNKFYMLALVNRINRVQEQING